jgi:hypothetical protein
MNLDDLESQVYAIDVISTKPETLAQLYDLVCAAMERVKTAKVVIEKAMLEHCIATGKGIEIGSIVKYAGTKKETKCNSSGDVLDALLIHFGGDIKKVAEMLGSEPWKHGAIGQELDESEYKKLFRVETKEVLVDGKPKKQLLTMNKDFKR